MDVISVDKHKIILYALVPLFIFLILFKLNDGTQTDKNFALDPNFKANETYMSLRNLALNAKYDNPSSEDESCVYSAVVDIRKGNEVVTLACYMDGTTSLLFSSGGGILGLGQKYEEIQNATIAFLNYASEVVDETTVLEASGFPDAAAAIQAMGLFPNEGHQIMYIISSKGITVDLDFETTISGSKSERINVLNLMYQEIMRLIFNTDTYLTLYPNPDKPE